jgi:uncharacterized membrane protein
MLHVSKSITVRRPREEVYRFWRDLENLPRFMRHLQAVTSGSDGRSHWIARAPAGQRVEWDAEIVDEQEYERLSWRTLEGSDIRHEGTVQFRDAPADRGTEVDVELHYEPPAGNVGAAVAKLFGEEPSQQIRDDLRRCKQVMETGEVTLSEGSLEGTGEGAARERPAQAPAMETRR